MSQYRGVMKWFSEAEGYGFSGYDDSQLDGLFPRGGNKMEGSKSLKVEETARFDTDEGVQEPQEDEAVLLKAAKPEKKA